jgi:hypothetical protein
VVLHKGLTFNAEYYRDNILTALIQFDREDDGRKFVVHADNASDLAPSDFFVFSYVKERLKGMVFPSCEELLDTRRNW